MMNRGTPMAMETPICLELPWASFSPFYIRLLQTVWHLRNHLISAGNLLGTHSWGLRSYLWIMFLDQCKCLLVTNENHVQFLWTFVQTFVNNELFVHGCWHSKVFQAILHRLLMDEPWCNKKAQPICKLDGPFPNPNCFERFERETTYFWHG